MGSRLRDGDALLGFILGSSWGDGARVRKGANGSVWRGVGVGVGRGEWSQRGRKEKRREEVCSALCSIVL